MNVEDYLLEEYLYSLPLAASTDDRTPVQTQIADTEADSIYILDVPASRPLKRKHVALSLVPDTATIHAHDTVDYNTHPAYAKLLYPETTTAPTQQYVYKPLSTSSALATAPSFSSRLARLRHSLSPAALAAAPDAATGTPAGRGRDVASAHGAKAALSPSRHAPAQHWNDGESEGKTALETRMLSNSIGGSNGAKGRSFQSRIQALRQSILTQPEKPGVDEVSPKTPTFGDYPSRTSNSITAPSAGSLGAAGTRDEDDEERLPLPPRLQTIALPPSELPSLQPNMSPISGNESYLSESESYRTSQDISQTLPVPPKLVILPTSPNPEPHPHLASPRIALSRPSSPSSRTHYTASTATPPAIDGEPSSPDASLMSSPPALVILSPPSSPATATLPALTTIPSSEPSQAPSPATSPARAHAESPASPPIASPLHSPVLPPLPPPTPIARATHTHGDTPASPRRLASPRAIDGHLGSRCHSHGASENEEPVYEEPSSIESAYGELSVADEAFAVQHASRSSPARAQVLDGDGNSDGYDGGDGDRDDEASCSYTAATESTSPNSRSTVSPRINTSPLLSSSPRLHGNTASPPRSPATPSHTLSRSATLSPTHSHAAAQSPLRAAAGELDLTAALSAISSSLDAPLEHTLAMASARASPLAALRATSPRGAGMAMAHDASVSLDASMWQHSSMSPYSRDASRLSPPRHLSVSPHHIAASPRHFATSPRLLTASPNAFAAAMSTSITPTALAATATDFPVYSVDGSMDQAGYAEMQSGLTYVISPASAVNSPASVVRSPASVIHSPASLIHSPASLIHSPASTQSTRTAAMSPKFSPVMSPRTPHATATPLSASTVITLSPTATVHLSHAASATPASPTAASVQLSSQSASQLASPPTSPSLTVASGHASPASTRPLSPASHAGTPLSATVTSSSKTRMSPAAAAAALALPQEPVLAAPAPTSAHRSPLNEATRVHRSPRYNAARTALSVSVDLTDASDTNTSDSSEDYEATAMDHSDAQRPRDSQRATAQRTSSPDHETVMPQRTPIEASRIKSPQSATSVRSVASPQHTASPQYAVSPRYVASPQHTTSPQYTTSPQSARQLHAHHAEETSLEMTAEVSDDTYAHSMTTATSSAGVRKDSHAHRHSPTSAESPVDLSPRHPRSRTSPQALPAAAAPISPHNAPHDAPRSARRHSSTRETFSSTRKTPTSTRSETAAARDSSALAASPSSPHTSRVRGKAAETTPPPSTGAHIAANRQPASPDDILYRSDAELPLYSSSQLRERRVRNRHPGDRGRECDTTGNETLDYADHRTSTRQIPPHGVSTRDVDPSSGDRGSRGAGRRVAWDDVEQRGDVKPTDAHNDGYNIEKYSGCEENYPRRDLDYDRTFESYNPSVDSHNDTTRLAPKFSASRSSRSPLVSRRRRRAVEEKLDEELEKYMPKEDIFASVARERRPRATSTYFSSNQENCAENDRSSTAEITILGVPVLRKPSVSRVLGPLSAHAAVSNHNAREESSLCQQTSRGNKAQVFGDADRVINRLKQRRQDLVDSIDRNSSQRLHNVDGDDCDAPIFSNTLHSCLDTRDSDEPPPSQLSLYVDALMMQHRRRTRTIALREDAEDYHRDVRLNFTA